MIRRVRATALILTTLPVVLCGCKATPSGKAETKVMSAWKHHVAVGNKKQKNPLAATPENIAAGKEAFSHYCVACHGIDGQNTGVPFANRLSPPVPSLKSADVQNLHRRPVEVDH